MNRLRSIFFFLCMGGATQSSASEGVVPGEQQDAGAVKRLVTSLLEKAPESLRRKGEASKELESLLTFYISKGIPHHPLFSLIGAEKKKRSSLPTKTTVPQEFEGLDYTGNKSLILPTYKDAQGQSVYVLGSSESEEGKIFYSPGCRHVATAVTNLSRVDGRNCQLFYRYLNIQDIFPSNIPFNTSLKYPQVAHLLVYGSNPEKTNGHCISCLPLPNHIKSFLASLPREMEPLTFIQMGLGLLDGTEDVHFVLGVLPTLFSYSYAHQKGKYFYNPLENDSYCSNILFMMFGQEFKNHPKKDVMEKMLNTLLILHAEHSTNASTSTVRNMKSAGSSYVQCLMAGFGTLSGEKHGGAARASKKMYETKIKTPHQIDSFIEAVKRKEENLMGMGHRIYDGPDPRYVLLRKSIDPFFQNMGKPVDSLLYRVLDTLDKTQKDSYFTERGVYPNVDALSWVFMDAIGIPENMFTLLFGLARSAGWTAHYLEEKGPIFRPQAIAGKAKL